MASLVASLIACGLLAARNAHYRELAAEEAAEPKS